ncbi:SDR family NAD(P)-dependent oxidoreductase [Bradyrhizobium sp. U87765 SZCCT0131]|uniref:SDR family NAD(P)-dependent oxidoreductase n=1 Tax=unclassified Bradyrhizobium TaxID=2631580 RepID=UPI001BA57B70|nr:MULTISPECIES: SDR family NAD(P)-dependent oxidoreductase [unclassified Bradyrhizobium]MBR1220458.1 SDR family NAD(P)-dependent oxidoreductase [Bradyrhizobium sp. U87765 SZCCT0131]MBR1263087.1 SDR family NAD(P)-dependent oxidoreductase [Bradyrhizobium sp. U87765 SZCCT0134]MBR1307030.1 SDR family NAD(P)-dependent oxidoreductase [Bradyrhizobium sp. U87765 SZCCT0110]MBR1323082.1 SDR family NAD(P)-dependent oxidoreductase [Bradyrhizobium sp. U87765 SZCCT0109]MBR1345984.1 SDR family NAD(P)-depend
MGKPTAIVVGVGAELGVGAAVCRRFAAEGYHLLAAGRTADKLQRVVDTIRNAGGSAEAVVADATVEGDVIRLFDHAMALGTTFEAPDAVVFNAGINRHIEFRTVTAQQFEEFWRVCCFGGFLVGREAARRLVPLGRGTVIFTGASASLRGKPGFAQFAAAKAGLRMISQSMARDYGKDGLHVAHVVVDGGVDGERLRSRNPNIATERGENGLLNVDAIAETYWQLHRQHRSAWTQEIDLRPFKETF